MEHSTYPDQLLKTFQDGARFGFADPAKDVFLRSHALGEVVITSGSIVVANPLDYPDWPAFTMRLPIGRFPVFFSDAHLVAYPEAAHHSVSAMVRFGDAAPSAWEIAWQADWDDGAAAVDPERDTWGYLNEWGFLAFMDAAAGAALAGRLEQDPDLANSIIEAGEEHAPESCQFVIDAASGLNMVTFPCNGPGVSPAFFGLARDGSVACLVVDCGYSARALLLEAGR